MGWARLATPPRGAAAALAAKAAEKEPEPKAQDVAVVSEGAKDDADGSDQKDSDNEE